MKAAIRKEQIMTAAIKLAIKKGYTNVTRDELAATIGCATGVINLHYGTMEQLRRAMIRHAITDKILTVVAQGIVAKDKHAMKVDDELKRAALNSLVG